MSSLRVDAIFKKKAAPAPAKKAAGKAGKKAAIPTPKGAKGGKGECEERAGARPDPEGSEPCLSHLSARPPLPFSPGNYFRGSADAALSKWYGEFCLRSEE